VDRVLTNPTFPLVLWATRKGSALGVGNDSRYTPTTTFETFPFPQPTGLHDQAISQAARYLDQAREFLRQQADPARKAGQKLGLTAMYNLLETYRQSGEERVNGIATLADAHAMLDAAVAAAYGWEWPLTEDEVLARLLALNLERASILPTTTPLRAP
jgi:hypothetical protein